jgi:phage terminase Nu1 subunit (DNA packaging protein)
MREDNEEEASVKRWVENRVRLARSRLNRRQIKQYEKEGRVLFRHL